MPTDTPMQLGMIGLGRMGANLVRRLMRDGHRCVAYDVNPDAVKSLEAEGATGRGEPGGLRGQAGEAAGHLDHGAGRHRRADPRPAAPAARGRRHRDRRRELLLPRRHHPGRRPEAGRHPLRRLRDQRRRLGPGPGLLPDDRRRGRAGAAAEPDLHDHRAREGHRRAHPGPAAGGHRRAGVPALRAERRRALRQDGAQRHRVRHDGRDRRGPVDHQARRRGPAPGARSTRRPRRCATPGRTSTRSTSARSPRCGGAARWSAPGWST